MQFTSALSSFQGSIYKKPILIFSLVVLSVSLILSGLILGGGSSESPVVRNFYLVTLRYNTESEFFKNYDKLNGVKDLPKDLTDKAGDKLDNLVGKDGKGENNKDEDKGQPSFHEIRVSYQGLCVDTSEGWDCGKNIKSLPEQDLANDPASLVKIADLYKDKIVWAAPFWFTVVCSGIAWILVLINTTPFFEMPLWTKTIATSMLIVASIANLGGMILGSVTSGSVAEIVKTVSFKAIEVHTGSMVLATGWASFALITVALIGVGAVTAADLLVGRVTDTISAKVESAFDTGSMGPEATRSKFVKQEAVKMAQTAGLGTFFKQGSLRK